MRKKKKTPVIDNFTKNAKRIIEATGIDSKDFKIRIKEIKK
jgi:hypothetical protein